MNSTVLVTGGAGYVGSHICKALKKANYTPIVFDNLSTGHRKFVKWGPLYVGDIKHQDDLRKVFDKYNIKNVIHCAAKASVYESTQNPLKYFEENIFGTTNLLDTFKEFSGITFILSSSCAVYGQGGTEKITEQHPLNPINPYGFSKLASEKILIYAREVYNFNFSILRYFNAAGADSDLEVGELHFEETHIIPTLIAKIKENQTFSVYGSDFQTPDKTSVRDYVHVTDLAEAHVKALIYNLREKKDLTCNLGSGRGISVLELFREFQRVSPNANFSFGPRRLGDPSYLVADIAYAKQVLDWKPENSLISNIVNTSICWSEKVSSEVR